MNISELFSIIKDTINKSDLISYKRIKDINIKKDIELCSRVTQIDINKFYYCKKGLSNIYYYSNYNLVDINVAAEEFLKQSKIKEKIIQKQIVITSMIKNGDFEYLFLNLIDSRISFWAYEEFFDKIPNKDKYPIFEHIYTSAEYGFKYLNKDFIKKVFKYADRNNLSKLYHLIDDKGYITIYRGQDDLSLDINKSYSWTTNINTAIFFATRFNYDGYIYSGKIHINNILGYFDNRDEDEIILYPENIKNVSKLDMLKFEEIIDELDEFCIIDKYRENAFINLKEEYFLNPKGIHGILHAKRVLLLSLILNYFDGAPEYTDILIYASMYHDIGRGNNDNQDFNHGKYSFKKINELQLLDKFNINDEDRNILKFIIDFHCIDDKEAINQIGNYSIKDKDKALFIFNIFKDADALDRVRIQDLDVNLLRTDISKKMPLLAKEFLSNIR